MLIRHTRKREVHHFVGHKPVRLEAFCGSRAADRDRPHSAIARAKCFPRIDPLPLDRANPHENVRDGKAPIVFRDAGGGGNLPRQGPRKSSRPLENGSRPAAPDLDRHGRRRGLRKRRAEKNHAERTTARKPS